MGLAEVVGQLGVSPVGSVEPLLGGPFDDPAADDPGQMGRDRRGMSLGLAGLEGGDSALEVSVEPVLNGSRGDAQVGGDVLVGSTPMGQPDDLEAIMELAIGRLEEGLFEASGVGVGQLDADHGGTVLEEEFGSSPPSTNQKASAGL